MSGTKPKYKVPLMAEIRAIPWNGLNVVSTFSGGGGSCLGYRMAGYHVVWANEFIEEAQKTYQVNHPEVFLNCNDIRTITPDDIFRESGLRKGEIDLLDGSPPCCSFSSAGKCDKGWGKEREYSEGVKQRTDDLFYEYIRLLNGLQTKVFIAENVSGLVKGKAYGMFKRFITEMRNCGYMVSAQIINAKWLGVPQSRERCIFIGVRNDLNQEPVFPKPLPYYYTLRDAIADVINDNDEVQMLYNEIKGKNVYKILQRMPKNPKKPLNGANYNEKGSYFNLKRESMSCPCSTICATRAPGMANNCHPLENRGFTITEIRRIVSLPDDFILTGNYYQQWERAGRMVPPIMMMHIAKTIEEEIFCKIKQ